MKSLQPGNTWLKIFVYAAETQKMGDKSHVGQGNQAVKDLGFSDDLNGMGEPWGMVYRQEQKANTTLGYDCSFKFKAEKSKQNSGLGRSLITVGIYLDVRVHEV